MQSLTVGSLREKLRKLPADMRVLVAHPRTEPSLDDVDAVRVCKDAGQTEEDVLVLVATEGVE